MKNLDKVTAPEDVPTKDYVDKALEVYVGATQPSDPRVYLWVQTP
jgi:hypothetical protein